MRMAHIKFKNDKDDARGLVEFVKRRKQMLNKFIHTMRSLPIITLGTVSLVISLLLVNSTFAQDVAIFYDTNLPTLGPGNGAVFANFVKEELSKKNLSAEVVDSEGLAEYMEANPEGIMLVCQGIVPSTIFENKGKDDLIYSWLREGGIGGFVGDYPFYYWDSTNNVAADGGQQKVFGVTVTNSNTAQVEPTELGKEYIPTLEEWTTNRPVTLATLESNGFEYESYADDGTNADPVAYRTEDMKGWFINFHTSCCGTALPPDDQMAVEYAELITNRFLAEGKSVEKAGKVSVVWGELKSGN